MIRAAKVRQIDARDQPVNCFPLAILCAASPTKEPVRATFKTVSRVLNGETNVREETRVKVLEAVKTLNYRTNHNARNLRARHSQIICLFYANPSRNYIGEVQLGALQRCQAYGYSLITEDCSDNHSSLLALRAETKLAGAILTPPLSDDDKLISELQDRGIPFVRIAPAEDVEHGLYAVRDEREGISDDPGCNLHGRKKRARHDADRRHTCPFSNRFVELFKRAGTPIRVIHTWKV